MLYFFCVQENTVLKKNQLYICEAVSLIKQKSLVYDMESYQIKYPES